MSAPKTNIDKQAKRHRGPILGITVGLVFVAVLALAAFVWGGFPLDEQAAPDGEPTETETVTAPEIEAPADEQPTENTEASASEAASSEEESQ